MKNRFLRYAAATVAATALAGVLVGCGSQQPAGSAGSAGSANVAPAAVITCSIDDIDYANIFFDYTDQIASEMAAVAMVPQAAAIELTAADANGATGVMIIPSIDAANTTDYYMNAYVAGNTINFAGGIASAESSVNGALPVAGGALAYVPAAIDGKTLADEVITFTMASGAVYKVHMIPETFPAFEITGDGVAADNAGVYSFALDKFFIRVNTAGELIYYRNMSQVGEELMAENFAPQNFGDKQYYSAFIELHPEFRNAQGGYSSGFYLVMNENYQDIDQVTLAANEEENHKHGAGYLDQHEFLVMGDNHYMLLSYTPLLIENLPASLKGIDGGNSAYVWAGIMQEVQDGKVVSEVNTADYPLLYESAVEKIDYAGSTDQGVNVVVGQNEVFSLADGIQDYVHVNSIDYTADPDGTADKILVSMRDQSAVFQFDIDTGALEWILGGKASTLGGYEEYAGTRTDDNGAAFQALTFGQHFARYTNKAEDGTISGNTEISVFDNHTGVAPFLTVMDPATLTRVFKATIDEEAGTAAISDVVDGTYLNEKTGKYHNASHCGSVQYDNENSVVIGWGLHGVVDNFGPMVPEGTMKDAGFDDLRQGSRPIVTEYDLANDSVTFELSATRNPNEVNSEAFFSYRTYKTAK
ncbi:MAG: aryl-sulfate sulfotransferase [Lachnospiraceae bacterium]|nr:aryl-sulfate sulfotransferase [Lachnospiraceae bacterium]